MANRFYSPDQQFISNSGVPYAGGFLYFYATGTSTPLNTYSDAALTIANTNPVVLDSNGQAGSVFLQNLAYKVVLQDSNHNQIWTMDPVYTSDYSSYAQFQVYNGNPNGFVAGTAGTVGTLPGSSVIWDYVDDILYVCTVTGNAATAVWTAVNSTGATVSVPQPQGYLTLSSDPSNPILTADALSQTAVYYTPYVGNLVPVFNGTSFVATVFTQLTLTLSASQASTTAYDVFVFNNSGVLTLVTGPAWTNSAAGTSARGTGAGTTQLQRLSGLWVNAVQISGRNGSTTYTVAANTATYVGSIRMDASAGQVSCEYNYGQSRGWGVWNTYNRQPILMQAGDATSSWSYAAGTVRAANGNAANNVLIFTGLPEEPVTATSAAVFTATLATNQTTAGQSGVGYNSTTAFSGQAGHIIFTNQATSAVTPTFSLSGSFQAPPALGANIITLLETGLASNVTTWNGTQANIILIVRYRG